MSNRIILPLLLFFALALPCLAQESATSRFSTYLKTMERAKTLAEVRPFFSTACWTELYGDVTNAPPEQQASMLSATSEMFKGWVVQKEVIKDGKATLSVANEKGEISPVTMILQDGTWVIDD